LIHLPAPVSGARAQADAGRSFAGRRSVELIPILLLSPSSSPAVRLLAEPPRTLLLLRPLPGGSSRFSGSRSDPFGGHSHHVRSHPESERVRVVLHYLLRPVNYGIQLMAPPRFRHFHPYIGPSTHWEFCILLPRDSPIIGPFIPLLCLAQPPVGLFRKDFSLSRNACFCFAGLTSASPGWAWSDVVGGGRARISSNGAFQGWNEPGSCRYR
jgi:hypothetical protein